MLSHKFKRRFVQGCFKLIKVDWIVNPDVFRRVTSNVFRCGMITSLFWPTKRKESIAPKIPDPLASILEMELLVYLLNPAFKAVAYV